VWFHLSSSFGFLFALALPMKTHSLPELYCLPADLWSLIMLLFRVRITFALAVMLQSFAAVNALGTSTNKRFDTQKGPSANHDETAKK